ncbi:GIY-YIG domain-containing protein [Clostridium cylindrosporum DSM 605]|uniref:GIY-YIG domain-containing protein n=2 Tax=Clostridium cylindrosporum TaxID=1495 RepID=A0A0J8D420_CLOCY|nr:GIY-YIG domain-containing protein [Clostridium cylindrosporum DSM 605]
MIMNYTYILECNDKSLYTGWTNDLSKRLSMHLKGKASKYTRARLPVKIVYYEQFLDKKDAMKREYAIKKLTRKQKLKLINSFNN